MTVSIRSDAGGTSGALQINGVDKVTFDTNSNLTVGGNLLVNSGYGSAAVAYGCRAWVNFNGTGTVAIRASGNVSSITDNGVGDYTINFTNPMPDVNYSAVGSAQNNLLETPRPPGFWSFTTSSVKVRTEVQATSAAVDVAIISAAIFR